MRKFYWQYSPKSHAYIDEHLFSPDRMAGSDGQVDMTVRRFCCRLGTCFQFQYIKMCFLIAVAGECYKARKIKRRRCAKKKKKEKEKELTAVRPEFLASYASVFESEQIRTG